MSKLQGRDTGSTLRKSGVRSESVVNSMPIKERLVMRQNKMLVSPSSPLVLPASLLLVLLVGVSTPSVRSADKIEGDHLATSDGDLIIHPINHATFVMGWKDKVIYVDPVGTSKRFY